MKAPPLITVWDGWATLDYGGHLSGPLNFQSVNVSLDEAADLADDLAGGPRVSIAPRSGHYGVTYSWSLSVRGFTEVDAYEALYAAAHLLGPMLPSLSLAAVYRLCDGELVPYSSIPSSSTSSPAASGNGS